MIFKMHKKEVIKRVSVLAITKVITFRLKKSTNITYTHNKGFKK